MRNLPKEARAELLAGSLGNDEVVGAERRLPFTSTVRLRPAPGHTWEQVVSVRLRDN